DDNAHQDADPGAEAVDQQVLDEVDAPAEAVTQKGPAPRTEEEDRFVQPAAADVGAARLQPKAGRVTGAGGQFLDGCYLDVANRGELVLEEFVHQAVRHVRPFVLLPGCRVW